MPLAESIEHPRASELAGRYDTPLLAADREIVLSGAP
jgi:hypothetical protein